MPTALVRSPVLLMRRFKLALSCLVLAAVLLTAWPTLAPVHGPGIAVMTWNVGNAGNPTPTLPQVVDVIRANGRPDILLLQESHGTQFLRDLATALGYAHVLPQPEAKSQGADTAILSDYPLTSEQALHWAAQPYSGSALLARAETPLGPILLGSAHLPAMHKERNAEHKVLVRARQTLHTLGEELTQDTDRSRCAQDLLNATATWPGHIILGGDFNTLSWTKALLPLHVALADALWPGPQMFHGTYVLVDAPLYPRIDFVFHDRGLHAREGAVGGSTPGDHLPVRAVLYGD